MYNLFVRYHPLKNLANQCRNRINLSTQLFAICLITVGISYSLKAQNPDSTFKPHGKPIIQVFGNFDYNATKHTKLTGFGLDVHILGINTNLARRSRGKSS